MLYYAPSVNSVYHVSAVSTIGYGVCRGFQPNVRLANACDIVIKREIGSLMDARPLMSLAN